MAIVEPSAGVSKVEHGATRPRWQRSTRCEHANCVEVSLGGEVLMRNSARPEEPSLKFEPAAWRDFVAAIKSGLFDR